MISVSILKKGMIILKIKSLLKKIIIFSTALSVSLGSFIIALGSGAGNNENLLVNGDFTEGSVFNVPGWSAGRGVGNRVDDGEIYLNVWWGKEIVQTVNLKANQSYRLTVTGRVENGNYGQFSALDSAGNILGSGSISSFEWKEQSFVFKTGADADQTVIKLHNNSTNFHVKKALLEECEDWQPDKNLLKNGDFSEGSVFSVPGWNVSNSLGARIEADGFVYLDIWQKSVIFQQVTLNADTGYILRFSAKRSSGAGYGIVRAVDVSGTLLGEKQITANDWQEFSLEFSTGKSVRSVRIELTNSNTNLNIRGISLEEYEIVIKNGGGEVHGLEGWNSLIPYGMELIDANNDVGTYHAALSRAHIENGIGGKKYFLSIAGNRLTYPVAPEKDFEYELSFDYHTSGVGTSYSIGNRTAELISRRLTGSGDGWSHYRIRFVADGLTDLEFSFILSAGETENSFFAFDNLAIVKTTDYENEPVITDFGSKNYYVTDYDANLFPGGDFETEECGKWDKVTGDEIFSVSDEQSRSGKHSLKIASEDGKVKKAVMWFDIEKNTDYVLTLSLLGTYISEQNLCDLKIRLINDRTGVGLDTGCTYLDAVVPTSSDNRWHRRAVEFNSKDAGKIGLEFTASLAICYIDDIALIERGGTAVLPTEKDIADDAALAMPLAAEILDTSTDIVTCRPEDNMIDNSDFSKADYSVWGELLEYDSLNIAQDRKDAANTVLKYSGKRGNSFNMLKWVTVEPNEKYVAYVRIRGDREGNVGFTVTTDTQRVAKYTTERWDGVWQTYNAVFNSNDSEQIGIGIFDGGGEISVDEILLCKYENAKFSPAPELPPLPGENWDGGYDKSTENTGETDGTISDSRGTVTEDDKPSDEGKTTVKKVIKKKTPKKAIVSEYVVTDWKTVAVIIGASVLAAAGIVAFVIIALKKKKKKKIS